MTPELEAEYAEAAKPFWEGGGAITLEDTKQKNWRIFLEINSKCSLHCPTCTKGNQENYEHLTGIMDADLMERIIDKIAAENPHSLVLLYGNSEPWIHPRLPECITAVKKRGLRCEFSTNLNYINREDEVLAAKPDMIIISLSGFTQEVYEKGHAGGKIEKVKANMRLLADANDRADPKINIAVNFHVYNDNQHEVDLMKGFALGLGLGFFTSIARAISMENAIQYCRSKETEQTPFEVQEGRPDWNTALPTIGETYKAAMDRLLIPPTKAVEMYSAIPLAKVCPVGAGSLFTFIRHDGKTEMCACVADRRITLRDYLDTTPDELIQERTGHAICKQCLRLRLNLYFMIADRDKWEPPL